MFKIQIKNNNITSYLLGCLLGEKKTISIGKDIEKLEPLYTVSENIKWYRTLENNIESSQKTKNRITR